MIIAIAVIATVGLLAWLWARTRAPMECSKPKVTEAWTSDARKASVEELRAYFTDAPRLRSRSIAEIVESIGLWDYYDDWDWGRIVFDWSRPTFRVMVMTQGGEIRKIALLDPNDTSRFGTEVALLLNDPFDIEKSGRD